MNHLRGIQEAWSTACPGQLAALTRYSWDVVNPQNAGVGSCFDLLPGSGTFSVQFPFHELLGKEGEVTPPSAKIPGLKSYVVFFGGFCVYLNLFNTALQKEKSFPKAISLEIFPKGLHI